MIKFEKAVVEVLEKEVVVEALAVVMDRLPATTVEL